MTEHAHSHDEGSQKPTPRIGAADAISNAISLIDAVWLAAPQACDGPDSRDAIQTTCTAAQDVLKHAYKLLTRRDHD